MRFTAGIRRCMSHLLPATKHDMQELKKYIMATQKELAVQLGEVLAQQKKTSGEIAAVQASVNTLKERIAELEAIIAGAADADPELVDAVAAVKAQAQVIDDQIPDLPVPEPPTP